MLFIIVQVYLVIFLKIGVHFMIFFSAICFVTCVHFKTLNCHLSIKKRSKRMLTVTSVLHINIKYEDYPGSISIIITRTTVIFFEIFKSCEEKKGISINLERLHRGKIILCTYVVWILSLLTWPLSPISLVFREVQ